MSDHARFHATLSLLVIAGLVPAIHAFERVKTWLPGTSPGMTMTEGGAQ